MGKSKKEIQETVKRSQNITANAFTRAATFISAFFGAMLRVKYKEKLGPLNDLVKARQVRVDSIREKVAIEIDKGGVIDIGKNDAKISVAYEEFLFWADNKSKPELKRKVEFEELPKDGKLIVETVIKLGNEIKRLKVALRKAKKDKKNILIKSLEAKIGLENKKLKQAKANQKKLKVQIGKIIISSPIHEKMRAYTKSIGTSKLRTAGHIVDLNPWSATFNSYLMMKALDSEKNKWKKDGFKFSGGHSVYVMEALVNRLNRDYSKLFWLYKLNEQKVSVGDIIAKSRSGKKLKFETAFFGIGKNSKKKALTSLRLKKCVWEQGGKQFTSHADIITTIRKEQVEINGKMIEREVAYTIGGNTRDLTGEVNTVGQKAYLLEDGKVRYELRKVNGKYKKQNAKDLSAWAIVKLMNKEMLEEWKTTELAILNMKELIETLRKKSGKLETGYSWYIGERSNILKNGSMDQQKLVSHIDPLLSYYKKDTFTEIFGAWEQVTSSSNKAKLEKLIFGTKSYKKAKKEILHTPPTK